ncbi:hypothetical protein EON63_22370 [archaeon]|nr:MAG: hypothetical protein EON63_22370 [archaeon]
MLFFTFKGACFASNLCANIPYHTTHHIYLPYISDISYIPYIPYNHTHIEHMHSVYTHAYTHIYIHTYYDQNHHGNTINTMHTILYIPYTPLSL